MSKALRLLLAVAFVMIAMQVAQTTRTRAADDVNLTIESWRTDDTALWDKFIADFEAKNPGIKVKFSPTNPPDFNGALSAKLKSGTAGDLITCRPSAISGQMFKDGQLADVTATKGLENFSDFAKGKWETDGKQFCIPMASVLHGFIYNKDYFDKNGFKEPTTYEEFLALLEAIKKEGSMVPLAIGTKEGWTTTSMGFDNIGPNFWGGEAGRIGLVDGSRQYNDKGFVAAFDALSKWAPYLPTGHEAVAYADAQQLFTSGKAAIFPAGSWEIAGFNKDADFKMGTFKAPPPAGAEKCYISDQIDIAMGANAASKNLDAAKKFLEYMTSEEFATNYSQSLPGFFSLSNFKIKLDDPLANTMLSWRNDCGSAGRSSYNFPSPTDSTLDTETALWNVTSQLLQGKLTAQQAGDSIQSGLAKWYSPAMKK